MNLIQRDLIAKQRQSLLPLRSIGWRGEGRGEVSRHTIYSPRPNSDFNAVL
jgi:hypothetical protein